MDLLHRDAINEPLCRDNGVDSVLCEVHYAEEEVGLPEDQLSAVFKVGERLLCLLASN